MLLSFLYTMTLSYIPCKSNDTILPIISLSIAEKCENKTSEAKDFVLTSYLFTRIIILWEIKWENILEYEK